MTSRGSLRFLHLALIVAAVASLGRGVPSAQSTPPLFYGLRPIGQLGGSQSAAYDVSFNGGVSAGRAQTVGGAYHAFAEGEFGRADVGTLGGRDSTAFAANYTEVVGQAQTASGQYHAFSYDANSKAKTDLGTLGGTWSAAYDTDFGIIVGASRIVGDTRMRAFQYVNGVMTPVAVDLGGDSVAKGVNNTNDIVGYVCTAGNASCRPFLFSNGVTTLIGPANRTGVANRVNASLDVVGALSVAPGTSTTQAFLYRNGVRTDLGTLGGASSEARGINEQGEVVGTAQNAAGQPRAFLWRNGEMTDLNTLIPAGTGWILESAAGISDGGQIVGYGTLSGKRRAFLLTPPTDLATFIGGTYSQLDSNVPRDGIEVGKLVQWTTSVWVSSGSVARTIFGTRMTHTLTGPAVFIDAKANVPFQDWGTCSVTPTTITCDFQPFFSDGLGREVTVRARATGIGAISHQATVSSDTPDPNPANNAIAPESNRAVALKTFTLTPATLAGGLTSVAELTLTDRPPAGDALVKLTSSRPDIARVPATFDIPGFAVTGRRQFPIVPAVVSAPTTVQITATYGLVTVTKTLTVVPPTLKQLYLTPTTVIGGCGQSQGRLVLNGAAPAGGAVVPLTNSNSKATVPKNVTVPAGTNTVNFTVTTVPVTTLASGVVTTSFGGVSQSLNLTVRPVRAKTLTLSNTRVRGGTTVNGMVTLECPAVPGAIAVSFTTTNANVAAATVPSITIPTGGTAGSFSVRTSAVSTETAVTIYAYVFGVRKPVTLTVTP
jgi:probable HAF family extracellular repeat protein